MESVWQIEKINLKHHIPLHLLVCILLLGISPLLMGVANLSAEDTAKVLERYVALLGIILIVPVFLPEQDKNLRDLVYAKYRSASSVYLIRLLGNGCLLALFLGGYLWMLRRGNCTFPTAAYFLGTYAEMLFLGSIGLCCYGLFDHLVAGYMASMVYYITALGSGPKYLKMFYPFSMSMGSYTEKFWLAAAAIALTGIGIFFRCRRK